MSLRIEQSERRAPRPAEDEVPFGYPEMYAEGLNVIDEILSSVFANLGAGC